MNKMIKVLFCGLLLFAAGIVKAQDNVAYQDGAVRLSVEKVEEAARAGR